MRAHRRQRPSPLFADANSTLTGSYCRSGFSTVPPPPPPCSMNNICPTVVLVLVRAPRVCPPRRPALPPKSKERARNKNKFKKYATARLARPCHTRPAPMARTIALTHNIPTTYTRKRLPFRDNNNNNKLEQSSRGLTCKSRTNHSPCSINSVNANGPSALRRLSPAWYYGILICTTLRLGSLVDSSMSLSQSDDTCLRCHGLHRRYHGMNVVNVVLKSTHCLDVDTTGLTRRAAQKRQRGTTRPTPSTRTLRLTRSRVFDVYCFIISPPPTAVVAASGSAVACSRLGGWLNAQQSRPSRQAESEAFTLPPLLAWRGVSLSPCCASRRTACLASPS